MTSFISIFFRSAFALALVATALPAAAQQQQRAPAQQQRAPAPAQRPAQQQAAPQQQPAPQQQAQPLPPRPPAQPLPPEGTPVVVVDYNAVVYYSNAGQSARAQLDKRAAQLKQEIATQEADLRKVQEDLEKQRSILTPDAFGQRQRDFQTRVNTYQQGIQERGRLMDDAARDTEMRLQKEVNAIIGDIMTEQRYQIVLQKNLIVASQTQLEISDEVLKRLNKKLATFTVNFAKN